MCPLMSTLGLYFQIRDDYANLNSKEVLIHLLTQNNLYQFQLIDILVFQSFQYESNKSYCEDLTEGKFSFPVIHAIRSRPDDQQIVSILRQRTKDTDLKRYCVSLLDKFGSFDYTRQTLVQLDLDARREIVKLGGNPILERVLDELKNWQQTDPVNSDRPALGQTFGWLQAFARVAFYSTLPFASILLAPFLALFNFSTPSLLQPNLRIYRCVCMCVCVSVCVGRCVCYK